MAKLTARKRTNLDNPAQWLLRETAKPVFYRLDVLNESVNTQDGKMVHVALKYLVDIAEPSHDVAALVGKAIARTNSGNVSPESPELWYWRELFWVKAVDSMGIEYYKNKGYILYNIDVKDSADLMSLLVI